MHRALVKLLKLRMKAYFRKVWRGMQSPARAIMTLVTFGLIAMYGVGVLGTIFFSSSGRSVDPEVARTWLPVGFMLFFLVQLVSPGKKTPLVFSPAEIDFLFAGPFHRHQLVIYKILIFSSVILFSSLFMSTYASGYGAWWPAAFTGLTLYMMAIYFMAIILSLVLQNFSVRHRWWVQGGLLGFLLIAVSLIVRFYLFDDFAEDPIGSARRLSESRFYAVALAPFLVFSEIALAQSFDGALLLRTMAAVGMNVVGLVLVLRLDAQSLESSLEQSQRMHKRLENFRQGKLFSGPRAKSAKINVPVLPHWRGVGTILRQQLLGAMRGSLIIQLTALAVLVGVVGGYFTRSIDDDNLVRWMPLGVIAYLMIILSTHIRYDFRSDVNCLERLKLLPMDAFPLALGEIAVPTLMTTFVQVVLCACFALANGSAPLNPALVFVLLSVNGLIFAIENAFFLVFPTRKTMASMADASDFGRSVLLLMAKGLTVFIVLGVAAGTGALAYFVSSSYVVSVFAGWIVLTACTVAFIFLVAEAFRRLDPSIDFG